MTTSPTAGSLTWTEQQRRVIAHREGNLVVSASAGSGKTAVLTERVLQLIAGEHPDGPREPIPLDRLLIITFTEKAAREMRDRIEGRIKSAILSGDERAELRVALDALPGAPVMTIDAFCRRLVIEHFHRAGIAPDPRVPDEAERAQLEQEVFGRLLDAWADDPARREALTDLLRAFPNGVQELIERLAKLMRFLESLDDPEAWTSQARLRIEETLRAGTYDALPEVPQAGVAFGRTATELASALREAAALARARQHDPPALERWEAAAAELERLAAVPNGFHPDALRHDVAQFLAPIAGKLENKGVCGGQIYANQGFTRSILKPLSRRFVQWSDQWFALDEAGRLRGAHLAAGHAARLLELAVGALEQLTRQKRRRGLVSFNDFERLALGILSDPTDPAAPSDIAYALRRQFLHVLVDEFQDTSPLQHRIVNRVARPDDPGNLFVVGDYKQSIYRFRFAEPELFLGLIAPDDGGRGSPGARFEHFRLNRNFRSRPGVLAFVNAVFERLMDPAVGEVDYRAGEQLEPDRMDPAWADPVCVEARWLTGSPPAADSDEAEEDEQSGGETLEWLTGVEAQAAWVARRIRELTDPQSGLRPARKDAAGNPSAPIRPNDCAILLRGLRNELDTWVRALESEGLKVRAAGVDPLLTAPELLDLLAALRLADNPVQDLPLATVLRSPLAGFSDDDLLRVRMAGGSGAFHEAVWHVAGRVSAGADDGAQPFPAPDELVRRLADFLVQLDRWRGLARTQSAAEVLEAILADSAYEAWLSGQPDASARLERVEFLRALLRRQSPAPAGRNPLAAFLEQVDRALAAAERFAELPEPAAGQDQAVHLLTIHAAKGLEFPVVFLPRLERPFHRSRQTDLLIDRHEGLALRGIDADRRRQYPTLALAALGDAQRRRDRSEELRLLYVALTRARERLVLVGQVADRERLRARTDRPGALDRLHARSPMDLVGPVVESLAAAAAPDWLNVDEALAVSRERAPERRPELERALARDGEDHPADWSAAIRELCREAGQSAPPAPMTIRLLPSLDPGRFLTTLTMKTTVTRLAHAGPAAETEIEDDARRDGEAFLEEEMLPAPFERKTRLTDLKPCWIGGAPIAPDSLEGSRRGTLIHQVLARVSLTAVPTPAVLRDEALRAFGREGLPTDGDAAEGLLEDMHLDSLAWFFTTEPGRAMLERPRTVWRELPLTARKAVRDFSPEAGAAFPAESILMQGIVDAVIDEGDRVTVLDYKTDRARDAGELERRIEIYREQVGLYRRALEAIWQVRAVRAALVLLDARRIVWLE